MNYPEAIKVKVEKIFGDREVEITLYSGLTTFIGTNASGKTQTLKALKKYLAGRIGFNKVRYLSSNRIGDMEQYRSKANRFNYPEDRYELGDQETKKMRKQIETATGDFFAMDDRKDVYIKVSERLSVLFKRQVFIRWDAGKMKVFFGEIGSEREYSVAAEASGLINVISILAALYDEEIEVLLIDEPEVSLHPQLQSYLLREMKRSADRYNKSIIISTHSAEMIDLRTTDDLPSFVFFKNRGLPKQIAPDAPELNNNKFKDFFFQMNLTFHEGFFAKKILLLEGSSDLIISCYLGNRLELNLDVAGAQIIPVNGKGQFPVVVKLFRLIGKEVGQCFFNAVRYLLGSLLQLHRAQLLYYSFGFLPGCFLALLGVDRFEYFCHQLYLGTGRYREDIAVEVDGSVLVLGFGEYISHNFQHTKALVTNHQFNSSQATTTQPLEET